jgi:hypothetical protein
MRVISCFAGILLGCLLFAPSNSFAQKSGRAADQPVVSKFQSQHFLIHTDLSSAEAHELLKQLETELKLLAAYWGRPMSGALECYVAKDLAKWPEELQNALEPDGLAKIREGAGVCISRSQTSKDRFVAKSRVYAVANDGVPLHEAVHGYCWHTFGRCGPRWYSEGMAELGQYWVNGQKGVNANPNVIKYLRETEPKKIEDLIDTTATPGGTWKDYAWWWFLCHLLENNTNYTTQFRALGPELLAGKDTGFRQIFGQQIKELTFEYDFFLKHLEAGYRVDLCSWDWKRKFFTLNASRTVSATIQANRGWQPSGLTTVANAKYEYSATGSWSLGKDSENVDADGQSNGRARLVGVLLKDYQLGKEFELGKSGSFTAPSDGNLYLRCRCDWSKIADNSGRIAVKFKSKGSEIKSPKVKK